MTAPDHKEADFLGCSVFVGIWVRTHLRRDAFPSPICNQAKLALAAAHKARLEFMRPGLGAGCEQSFEEFSLEIRTTALNDVPVSHGSAIKPTRARHRCNG